LNTGGYKYENFKNKICPYCQSRLKKGADITVCSECGTPHHKECWDENNGCTSYGCQNNPLSERTERTERSENSDPEDVGSLTVESIRHSLNTIPQEDLIQCTSCSELIESSSVFCKYCGYNLKENEAPEVKSAASDDFKKEYKKRYREKITFARRRQIITYSSILLLILAIGLLVYISINRLNEYFASDKYRIQILMENYELAIENRNSDSLKIYLTDDYEFYTKSGKRSGKNERIRKFESIFKNTNILEYNIRDLKVINDTSVTANDKKIKFRDELITDKLNDSEEKIMRIYKSDSTGNEWKIYREITE